MKLLSAEEVKSEKEKGEEERTQRIQRLNAEENASGKRLNEARELEKKELARIADELNLARNEAEAEVRKSVLVQEIRALNAEKAQALKPIHEQQKQADKNLEESKRNLELSQKDRDASEKLREIYEDKIDALADRETAAVEKDRELQKREVGIGAAEAEIKRSTTELGQKWVDFHKAVHAHNASMEERERRVEAERKANDDHRAELEKTAERQAQERIALKDGYETLARAQEEILGKKL